MKEASCVPLTRASKLTSVFFFGYTRLILGYAVYPTNNTQQRSKRLAARVFSVVLELQGVKKYFGIFLSNINI